MNELIANFHFLQPLWLLILLPLPLLLWWLTRSTHGSAHWARLADPDMLPLLLIPTGHGRQLTPWLLGLIWLLLGLAFAGPAWERLPTPLEASGAARVIALSLSDSMLADDIKPDRLSRARFKIRDMLGNTPDGQNALIAYAGDAFVVAPLTSDVDTVLNLLDALKPDVMPVQGNNAARAVDEAVDLLRQAAVRGGDVLLVTDSADADAVAAARRALATGVHVSVLAVGTRSAAPVSLPQGGFLKDAHGNIVIPRLATAELRELAVAGGGRYQPLSTDNSDVQALLAASHDKVVNRADESLQTRRWRDRGPWLLLLLVPLAALGFRRGWLMVLALALCTPTGPAQAGVWSDLWRNGDQQAAAALAAGKPDEAGLRARSPGLRGAAAYRNGDFAKAADDFAGQNTAQAQYNLGNALAQQGSYEKAIGAWDKALAMDPQLADARANRKAVEDWLKQRKQQQGESSAQGSKSKQGQGKKDQASGQQQDDGKSASQSAQGKSASEQQKKGDDQGRQQAGESGGQQQEHPGNERNQDEGEPSSAPSATSAAPAASGSVDADLQPVDAAQAEKQREENRQAQQAVKKAVNEKLDKSTEQGPHLLTRKAEPYDKDLPQAMRQQLQRVPDDPGGLLRRKFMLEYQQRQQNGGGS